MRWMFRRFRSVQIFPSLAQPSGKGSCYCCILHINRSGLNTINKSVGCLQTRNSSADFRGKELYDGNPSHSRRFFYWKQHFHENGNFVRIGEFRGKYAWRTTRAVIKVMAARREIRYLPRLAPARQLPLCSVAFSHPSLATEPPQCFAGCSWRWSRYSMMMSRKGDRSDGKTSSTTSGPTTPTPGVLQFFAGVMWRVSGVGRQVLRNIS